MEKSRRWLSNKASSSCPKISPVNFAQASLSSSVLGFRNHRNGLLGLFRVCALILWDFTLSAVVRRWGKRRKKKKKRQTQDPSTLGQAAGGHPGAAGGRGKLSVPAGSGCPPWLPKGTRRPSGEETAERPFTCVLEGDGDVHFNAPFLKFPERDAVASAGPLPGLRHPPVPSRCKK